MEKGAVADRVERWGMTMGWWWDKGANCGKAIPEQGTSISGRSLPDSGADGDHGVKGRKGRVEGDSYLFTITCDSGRRGTNRNSPTTRRTPTTKRSGLRREESRLRADIYKLQELDLLLLGTGGGAKECTTGEGRGFPFPSHHRQAEVEGRGAPTAAAVELLGGCGGRGTLAGQGCMRVGPLLERVPCTC